MLTSHGSAALYVVKVLRGAPPADTKKGKVADGAAAAAREVCLNILLTLPGVEGNVTGGSLGLSWRVFVRVCVCAVGVRGWRGRGSGLLRLQGGPECLHEQEEEPPDDSDVHRPVQQIPGEYSRPEDVAAETKPRL